MEIKMFLFFTPWFRIRIRIIMYGIGTDLKHWNVYCVPIRGALAAVRGKYINI